MIATQTPAVEEFIRQYGDRCEFVRGDRIEKALPSGSHSDIQISLGAALLEYGRRTGAGKPRSEWHHRFGPADDVRVYIPDLVFLLAPRHLDPPEYADSASDIMIEIVSPGDSHLEVTDKVEFYLRHGVKSVWLIDPRTRRVSIYKPGHNTVRLENDAVLTEELLPGFELRLSELFPAT
jgi:Uma2 family endonuclease